MFRARETWLWIFLMPVLFFYLLGKMSGGRSSTFLRKEPLAVHVSSGAGFLAEHLLQRLRQSGYEVIRVSSAEVLSSQDRQLTIPAGFTATVLAGTPVKLNFVRSGGGLGADYDKIRLNRAVYSLLADLIVLAKETVPATSESLARLESRPRTLTLHVEAATERRQHPRGYQQSIPGSMVMFTLLVLFTTGGLTLTIERNTGILRRLASSPMSRGAVVLGKWTARMSLGLIQLAFAMAVAVVLFRIQWGPDLPAVVLVLFAYAALAASLGMLVGNFGRTEGQVVGVGVIATNVLAALGGCWWPIEITPRWAQQFALFLPTGWAMDALHKLVTFGLGPASVIPHVIALAAFALLAGYVLARTFRFQ